jgi:hypothetical protein
MSAFRPRVCVSEALRLGLLTTLLLTLACGPRLHRTFAAPQDNAKATGASMPTFTELQPGWNLLRPGGETGCAKGGEYAFSVRPAARDKLLVFFQGGGACAVAERCAQGQPWYNPEIDLAAAKTPRLEGIFEFANPDNPFSAYSAVVVRYCTGDVHLGNRDVTYTIADDKGQSRRFEIRHRGYANASAVLRWIQANFTAPQKIFVSGVSAGSVATPFYASVLARQYPKARVVGLGDAQGHDPQIGNEQINDVQRMRLETVRRLPGWEKIATLGTRDRYITAARSAPQLQLFQFNHAYDAVSRTYFGADVLAALRNGELNMLTMLRANQRDISRDVPTFRYFNVGGREHGALTNDRFYGYATNGHRFRDWVAAIEAGDPVASVDCIDCTRSEFRFSEQDLRIVERSLELISRPSAWISDDPSERCRPNVERFPLRCALYMAINEVTSRPPTIEYPGAMEVIYTAIARMGPEFEKLDEAQRGSESLLPLRLYNNRPGTTAADVISLLEEVRDRIRAQLRPKAD